MAGPLFAQNLASEGLGKNEGQFYTRPRPFFRGCPPGKKLIFILSNVTTKSFSLLRVSICRQAYTLSGKTLSGESDEFLEK